VSDEATSPSVKVQEQPFEEGVAPVETKSDEAATPAAPNGEAAPAQNENRKPLHIEWTPIDEASGYIIQIQDSRQNILLEKHVDKDTTKLHFYLEPGTYRQRVGVKNKFGRISTYTDWQNFIVLKPVGPYIRDVTPKMITKNDPTILNIFGDNFSEQSEVTLVLGMGGKKRVLPTTYTSSGMLQVQVEPETFLDGRYSIRITNPDGKKTQKNNALSINTNDPMKADRLLAHEGLPFWKKLVLGLPRYEKKDYITSIAQVGLFSVFSIGSGLSAYHANQVIAARKGNLVFNLYNDLLLHELVLKNLPQSNTLAALSMKEWWQTNIDREKYQWHRKHSNNLAAAAGAVYLLHLVDAFDLVDISIDFFGNQAPLDATSMSGIDPYMKVTFLYRF